MKLACSRCGQMSDDGHLWCPQIDCPAGSVPTVLTYGDYMGDIKVIRLLRLFRTAAIYEAERESLAQVKRSDLPKEQQRGENANKVLLKIAHSGSEQILKMEAEQLAQLRARRIPGLPVWLPPYLPANEGDPEYGKSVFRGEAKYYTVFSYIQGTFLRDMLYENPEPWFRDAAWITIGLTRTISELHRTAHVIHGNITPDVILVSRDEKTRVPRTTLLDLGVMYSESERLDVRRVRQIRSHVAPAYTAPEIVATDENGRLLPIISLSNATDVYGLGLLLHEMLAGCPGYSYALRSDEAIIADVQNPRFTLEPVRRPDVPKPNETVELLTAATAKQPDRRYATVGEFRKKLIDYFGDVPPPPRGRLRSLSSTLYYVAIGAAVLVVLAFIVLVLISLIGG